MSYQYSLIIPCFNEENNIHPLIQSCHNILSNNKIQLILVDNGSTDNTSLAIDKHLKKNLNLKKITIKKNIGFGNGVILGLINAEANIIGYTHADLQTDPNDFLKAINILNKDNLKNGKFLIKGRRKKRRQLDNIFTILMSIFESLIFGKYMFDINAQPVIFHKKNLKSYKKIPKDFMLDLYIYNFAKKNKHTIKKIDVNFLDRVNDEGSNDTFKKKIVYSLKTILSSIRLKFNLHDFL